MLAAPRRVTRRHRLRSFAGAPSAFLRITSFVCVCQSSLHQPSALVDIVMVAVQNTNALPMRVHLCRPPTCQSSWLLVALGVVLPQALIDGLRCSDKPPVLVPVLLRLLHSDAQLVRLAPPPMTARAWCCRASATMLLAVSALVLTSANYESKKGETTLGSPTCAAAALCMHCAAVLDKERYLRATCSISSAGGSCSNPATRRVSSHGTCAPACDCARASATSRASLMPLPSSAIFLSLFNFSGTSLSALVGELPLQGFLCSSELVEPSQLCLVVVLEHVSHMLYVLVLLL